MSRLTLRLPETLHQQLIYLAEVEGVSLNQYIVYALTRQVASSYTVQATSETIRKQQAESFGVLLKQLGEASPTEIKAILEQRERVPESELSLDVIERLQKRIGKAISAKKLK